MAALAIMEKSHPDSSTPSTCAVSHVLYACKSSRVAARQRRVMHRGQRCRSLWQRLLCKCMLHMGLTNPKAEKPEPGFTHTPIRTRTHPPTSRASSRKRAAGPSSNGSSDMQALKVALLQGGWEGGIEAMCKTEHMLG